MADGAESMPEASGPAAAPRRRLLVIHNPVAGARRARRLGAVLELLEQRHGAAVTLRATGGRGDAEAMARAVAPGAFDAVIAAGGDGTINEVVNGLGARRGGGPAIPLGIVPLGTANVLAHELALPLDAEGAARVLAEGRPLPVHLGVANGRTFAMMAGAGLDARVVERVDPRLKRLIGKGAYAVETLARIAAGGGGPYRVAVDGGEPVEAASVIVAKGHFYGGRFVCAPDARLADPWLHVCLFPRSGRGNALRYLWGVTAGRLPRFPDYRVLPARRVVVEGPVGEPVQGDGDVIARLPVEIALAPWILPVLAL
ncbi:diacylglycerol/lipid kinase family protein [Azospirillum brasilense]|uniref:diacylglycerol/lipid kinase family protein n=1 Tax=Azospirillum brasilense TaxID=192 RepID=UPI0027DE4ADE|nr:diacylglycerol kinase family lipid kinase [Azospirillum brasilense]